MVASITFSCSALGNSIEGVATKNVDLALSRVFRLIGTQSLEFRAEAFNAFNHTNFFVGAEANDINSTSFGRITQSFDPRILQFALKLNF